MTAYASPKEHSKTSPRSIKMWKRIAEALEYRREGYSYDEITEYMAEDHPKERIYKQKVHQWVMKGMRAIAEEPAMDNLKLDLERLDGMLRAAYVNATKGDIQSIGACLGIIDRRARIFGYEVINAPPEAGSDEVDDIKPIKIQIVDKRRKDRPPRKRVDPDTPEDEAA